MTIKDRTFGSVLMQFANAVDHIDDGTFGRIGDQIKRYVAKQLAVNYFDFQVATVVDDERPALVRVWASEGAEGQAAKPRTLHTDPADPTSYRNQSSYAFSTVRPVWIICPDRSPLYEGAEFHDDWSQSADVPAYQKPIDRDLRTSIIVPVVHEEDVLGVINLESDEYIESTPVARRELRLLAAAIAEVYLARTANIHQTETTRSAINDLRDILEGGGLPRLTKPQIFIASSGRADDAVVASIERVLESFEDQLDPMLWSDSSASGNITSDILKEISGSSFGLCYFSEPGDDDDHFYRDNPNVIFEAGMLHSLTNTPTEHPTGWIPVRETDSPPTPFDFAQERTVPVPRGADGEFDAVAFEEALTRRLSTLLGG